MGCHLNIKNNLYIKLKKLTAREEKQNLELFLSIFGIFHIYLVKKTWAVQFLFACLIYNQGLTEDIKFALAVTVFLYIFCYFSLDKKNWDELENSANGCLKFLFGLAFAWICVYLIYQI